MASFVIWFIDMQPWQIPSTHTDLHAPALTCHLAFLKSLAASDMASERRKAINKILEVIHKKCNVTHTPLDRNNLWSSVQMDWRSTPVRLLFLLTREIVSLTIYINAGHAVPLPDPASDPGNILKNAIEYVRSIMDIATDVSRRADLTKIHETLFETLWDKFFEENKEIPPPNPQWSWFSKELKDPVVIVDWRGLVALMPSHADHAQTVREIQPFICCRGITSVDDFAICTMYGERFFHASTMGNPPTGKPFYILLCHSSSQPAELRELIAIGNKSLVYRFAAVAYKTELETAWRLSGVSNRNIDEIHSALINKNISANDLTKKIDEIARMFTLDIEERFVGGINDRLRNTKEYINEFNQLSDILGIKPVENRRNYKEIAHEVLSNMLNVVRQIESERDRFRDDLVKLRNTISLASVAQSSEKTLKEETHIIELQTVAEFLAFLIFVPYYFGNAASDSYHVWYRVGKEEHDLIDQIVWGMAWILGFVLVFWRLGFWGWVWRSARNLNVAWAAGALAELAIFVRLVVEMITTP